MRKNDRYRLLYNQLWVGTTSKIQQLSPDFEPAKYLDFEHVESNKASSLRPLVDMLSTSLVADNKVKPPLVIPTAHKEIASEVVAKAQALVLNEELIKNWDVLIDQVNNCSKCNLCHARKNVVIERGNREAKWMFIGEGPGEQEDIAGLPFVGASGQLLDKMIAAMKLDKDKDVYICNVVKCRPPYNRNPELDEINSCKNYLLSQIANVRPQIIVALGRFASQTLLDSSLAIGKLRSQRHLFQEIPLIVTYHPSYLLRNPSAKKEAWDDLQLAMQIFGMQV